MFSLVQGIPVWGSPIDEAVQQMVAARQYQAEKCALMADHHIGYSVPIGGVIAYDGLVCPNGVGFDIACGNKAVRLDADFRRVKEKISQIMDEVGRSISFGIGRKNKDKVDDPLFDDPLWGELDLLKSLKEKARLQLGTVGSGNHYIDIFSDEQSRIWVGVHFGSRGLGHSICTHFIKTSGGQSGIHAKPVLLEEKSDLGEQYIQCMQLAGKYAYAGRNWVCSKVANLLGSNILEGIHNHHNYAWKETHAGKEYWVVRKGATPAFPGQKGFVGGSMGDISVIVEGVESKESQQALYSTIHGAGRRMGRNEAKGKTHRKTGIKLKEGKVDQAQHEAWLQRMGVDVRGGDLDESPYAYKRIEEVLAAHKNTIRILHTLKPIGVCMAGPNEFDPYKD